MVSPKTFQKMLCVSEEERNKMVDKMTEENAKYLLKIALKFVTPSDEQRKRNMDFLGVKTNQ